MAYALETKKRKFDRVLESITDGQSAQTRSSLNSRNNASTVSVLPDTASDTSKRRRVTPPSALQVSKTASTASLTSHYLPSSRTAFLERLETFRHVTKWHVPSTEPINASIWAKRGWICVDTDTVSCGSCKGKLRVDLDMEKANLHDEDGSENAGQQETDGEESFSMSQEMYEGMVRRYQDMVVTAHSESCPWRKRGCDASVQRIEGLLNTWNTISALQTRYNSMTSRPEDMPEVCALPSVQGSEQELQQFLFEGIEIPVISTLKLAVAGWQGKYEDVIECQKCFRSLGLWLYRGDQPTMEKLDAVESHLEYCPWRSPEAQDTEIAITTHEEKKPIHKQERVAGWVLVCLAVAKDNAKKRSSTSVRAGVKPFSEEGTTRTESEVATPEQREKKMKELMKRIKELKKPFNVKSLLKKKEKPKP